MSHCETCDDYLSPQDYRYHVEGTIVCETCKEEYFRDSPDSRSLAQSGRYDY